MPTADRQFAPVGGAAIADFQRSELGLLRRPAWSVHIRISGVIEDHYVLVDPPHEDVDDLLDRAAFEARLHGTGPMRSGKGIAQIVGPWTNCKGSSTHFSLQSSIA